jgi:hypothetical protein
MNNFSYGGVLPPELGLFEFVTHEPGRAQMCVTETVLEKIAACRPHIPNLTWECEQNRCCSGMSRLGRTVMSVTRWKAGWRIVRCFFDEWAGGIPHDLCWMLNDHVVVFPDAKSAIDAAEIFSDGPHCEVAPLAWITHDGRMRFGGPSLLEHAQVPGQRANSPRRKRPSGQVTLMKL